MKYFTVFLCLLALPFSTSAATELPTAPPAEKHVSAQQLRERHAERLRQIEVYLSNIGSITSDFSQVAPDGSITNGKFFMKRPGRMRWQYNPPTPILMISDGSVLTYYDYELEQVSNLPLDSSLIGFLAQEKIEFSGTVTVEKFEAEKGTTRVTLVQTGKPTDGKLMLEFSDEPLQLRNMVVTDASGQMTTVLLQNAKFGEQLSKDLFIFRDPRKRRRT